MAETIEVRDTSGNGTSERVSLDLMKLIVRATKPGPLSKEDLLNLYVDCRRAVLTGKVR